jgi:hypothetical protein
MKHHPPLSLSLVAGALLALPAQAAPFYSENFDALILGPKVSSSEVASYDPDGDGPLEPVTNVWTATTPTGWTMTKGANHVNGAVAEFDGWTFADPRWWSVTAGQNRNLFTKGKGVIAVADSDEYDDLISGTQRLEATLSSPPIDISGKPAGGIVLRFDSSWRAEPQTGTVTVSYDGGAPVTVLTYDSTTPTAYDATVQVSLANPAGASSMVVSFYHTGANNWWWAIDNVEVDLVDVIITSQPVGGSVYAGSPFTIAGFTTGGGLPATYQWFKGQGVDRVAVPEQTGPTLAFASTSVGNSGFYSVEATAGATTVTSEEIFLDVQPLTPAQILFSENFDSAPLGYPVQEGSGLDTNSGAPVVDGVWTATAPAGWTVNHINVVGIGDPDKGVQEWEGFTFVDPDWWYRADNQNRSLFTRGGGAVAVADPDEWDDLGNPDNGDATEGSLPVDNPETTEINEKSNLGTVIHYNTEIVSPNINITGAAENSVKARFSSSWRHEIPQMAILWVSFDGGPRQKLFHWNGDSADVTNDADGIFKSDATNETVLVNIPNPAGATLMQLTFHMPQADNDWWWAIDNLVVFTGSAPADMLAAPNSQTVLAGGGAVSFETAPDGIGPFTFAWTGPGGTPLTSDEPTDPTSKVTINSPTPADAGNYRVTITNPAGSIQSNASLRLVPFQFELQPADKTGGAAVVGGTDAFIDAVILSYDDSVSYQWFKWVEDDTDPLTPPVKQAIPGAGSANTDPNLVQVTTASAGQPGLSRITLTLTLASATPTTTTGDYSLEISNDYGTLNSRTAALQVEGLVIVDNVDPVIAEAGSNVTLSVLADSFDPISYQWFKGQGAARVAITDEISPTLSFSPIEAGDTGYYSVDVSIVGTTPVTLTSREAKVTVYVPQANTLLFAENFDSLPLGPNVDEATVGTNVWTKTGPAGWTIDDSGVPGAGTDNDGVTEWAGWSFANTNWWATTAGDQGRTSFTKSTGAALIADPDEWDDLAHAAGQFNAFISTPDIALNGAAENSAVVTFDSSWQYEAPQGATFEVSFDGGTSWSTLLRYSSNTASGDFKPDAFNETISIPVFNPAAATTARFRFGLITAGNNWWWAVDNFRLTGTTPLDGFATWAAGFGLVANENGDGDYDGIRDLVEYALGLNPKVANMQPGLTPNGEGFTLSYTKGTEAAADPDITYILETSGNLVDWLPTGTQNPTSISAELPGGQGQLFGRLRIERAK